MRVQVLVLDGVFDTGLSVMLDALQTATELAQLNGKPSVRFDVELVGLSESARTQQGLTVQLRRASERARPEIVLVPALGAKMPEPLTRALARPDVERAGELLQAWSAAGATLAAACTGTFVLARSACWTGRAPPPPGGCRRFFASCTLESRWTTRACW
jgi:transcriptional regulator GlxA family with amidase domain